MPDKTALQEGGRRLWLMPFGKTEAGSAEEQFADG